MHRGRVLADDIVELLAEAFDPKRILDTLRRGQMTTAGLAAALAVDEPTIESAIAGLIDHGHNLQRFGEHWSLGYQPAARSEPSIYTSRPDGTYVFGVCSDQHLGSKYERLDILHRLYDWFAERGVDRVFNAGNWIDGEGKLNRNDLLVHGLEAQVDYLIANYPKRPGITTYAVWGDDHEGWFSQREAIDVGRFTERKMREAGRSDWVDLGFMEAAVLPVHGASGAVGPPFVVMHPGGGSAYAVSYRPQKIVESFSGGEKPSLLLIGHYHKISSNLFRNVWCLQIGCVQDQTPFMRKKSIEAHVGGGVITLEQDAVSGAITACTPALRQYFDRRYENARWSRSGPVAHAAKVEIGPR